MFSFKQQVLTDQKLQEKLLTSSTIKRSALSTRLEDVDIGLG